MEPTMGMTRLIKLREEVRNTKQSIGDMQLLRLFPVLLYRDWFFDNSGVASLRENPDHGPFSATAEYFGLRYGDAYTLGVMTNLTCDQIIAGINVLIRQYTPVTPVPPAPAPVVTRYDVPSGVPVTFPNARDIKIMNRGNKPIMVEVTYAE